ncbi:hypothetical protein APB26_31520 [Pseudomonas aeruginosa]|nr:hypothetical protein APB26_31520 [Pseudomonas aeruginosa]RPV61190.1 DUF3150 domain-containing protein [Pseudomonas aeruginosa]
MGASSPEVSMQVNQINVLNKILLVGIQINIWSARTKLEPQDLGLNEKDTPPAELASLGTLRSIDPEYISAFEQLRRKAKRIVKKMGLDFMGVFAIPEDKADAVNAALEEVEQEFLALRSKFLNEYDQAVLAWMNRPMPTQALKDAVVRSIVPKAHVADRIAFKYSLCRISPDRSPDLNKQLEREVNGLHAQLFSEIADTADALLQKSFNGKDKVGQKAVNCIRRIHEKLLSLAFLDPNVQALADHVQAKLADFPTKGNVEGAKLRELVSLLTSLSDETSIEKIIHLFNDTQGGVQVDQDLIEAADLPVVQAEVVQSSGSAEFDFVAAELDLDQSSVVPESRLDSIVQAPAVVDVIPVALPLQPASAVEDFCL